MSKLHVEICRIESINPIEGADRIVSATIKGWNCIIGKDQHKVGELVIFIPPDAVIPDELIESQKLSYLKGANRIRTIKLKGTISQGLVLPFNVLNPKGYATDYREGDDVAKELGITKYEAPIVQGTPKKDTFFTLWTKFQAKEITFGRLIRKSFALTINHFKPKKKVNPNFDVYTDLDNIKHYPEIFEQGEEVVITEKIHGTNFRAGTLPLNETVIGRIKQFFTKQTHEFCYGSHRVQKSAFSGKGFYGEDVYGQIAKKYNLKDIIPSDYIIYGEIYGPTVQELGYGLQNRELDVVFFDVKYKGQYLNWDDAFRFLWERKLPIVPILYKGEYNKNLLNEYTNGNTTIVFDQYMKKEILEYNPCPEDILDFKDLNQIREGCVVKPLIEANHPKCGRKILKSISEDYLLTKKQDKPEEAVDDNVEYPH